MSEHLKEARENLLKAGPLQPQNKGEINNHFLFSAMVHMYRHMEAQQETPASETKPYTDFQPMDSVTLASEPSSAPTTGPAPKRLPSVGANPDFSPVLSALMEQISDFFKSTEYTRPVLEARHLDSLTLELTCRWLTNSTETTTDGDRGVAIPDPSPESAAQPGREEWEFDEDFPYKHPGYGDVVASAPDGRSRRVVATHVTRADADRIIASSPHEPGRE